MKKFLLTVLFLVMLSGCSFGGEKRVIRLGLLSKLNTTEEQFSEAWKKRFAPNNENLEVIVKFYDSLTAMQLALEAGDIMQMVLPQAAAEYVLNQNRNYESVLVLNAPNMGLAFGFREDSKELRDKFNEALKIMRDNWILQTIEGIYTSSAGIGGDPEPVVFDDSPGGEVIKVAVTGDLPPIDFIAADGTFAGFNTAVLAEISSYLKKTINKSIELVEVNTGARTSSLVSGRTDVVFWYEVDTSSKEQHDVPEGVILSEPYYMWNKFVHIRKAPRGGRSGSWNLKRDILGIYNRW